MGVFLTVFFNGDLSELTLLSVVFFCGVLLKMVLSFLRRMTV
jgi:hypothetical protein